MLDYYKVDTRSAELKFRSQKISYIQHAENYIYNFASLFFINYVIIQIIIFDFSFILCFNISENVSLWDRSLISKNFKDYGFIYRIKLITIIEIANMQMLNEYIEQKVLLNSNKISVFIKTYIVNSLKPNFIINMNVLNKENIDFMLSRQTFRVKNIKISLCYVSSSIDKIIDKISYEASYKIENYYFYYFVVDLLNINNVNALNIKKNKIYFMFKR